MPRMEMNDPVAQARIAELEAELAELYAALEQLAALIGPPVKQKVTLKTAPGTLKAGEVLGALWATGTASGLWEPLVNTPVSTPEPAKWEDE